MLSTIRIDALVKQMGVILRESYVNYEVVHLESIVKDWYTNKENLINILRKHPQWDEDAMAIIFDMDIKRTINEYMFKECLKELKHQLIRNCGSDTIYKICQILYIMRCSNIRQMVDEHLAKALEPINQIMPISTKIIVGQKYSRVLNKLFKELKINEMIGEKEYNTIFAKLSDAINPLEVRRYTLLSVHPCDYLLMSNGTGWSSCHSILGKMGEYSNGTISYMRDGTSMVFYTINNSYGGNTYYREEKINRQMYMYSENTMLQSRLYPNENDENSDSFREIVQKIISDCIGEPNMWSLKRNYTDYEEYIITHEDSCHYADYNCGYDSTLSVIKNCKPAYIYIGNSSICVLCGREVASHDDRENLYCCCQDDFYNCRCCGEEVNELDAIMIDGEYYCENCIFHCDSCYQYMLKSDANFIGHLVICDACHEEKVATCDNCGEEWFIEDLLSVNDESYVICPDCTSDYYRCDNCGETYSEINTLEDGIYLCDRCLAEK